MATPRLSLAQRLGLLMNPRLMMKVGTNTFKAVASSLVPLLETSLVSEYYPSQVISSFELYHMLISL
jgi:hypothetical protein